MAGSVPTVAGQVLDITNGRLLSGGKLYTYAAGTTTPQLAFRDSGLTLPHPNPITLASDGRIPPAYFADGSVRCRLLNAAGMVQFDYDNLLVVGPSSGGGGGGSVDPTTIFQTGDVMWLDFNGARAGWVRDNARTIGSATSGASERANADCQALFLYLWANFSDGICPVVTGRGASALADWGANKQITLPDKRGYVPGGVDDMGNVAAGRYAGVPFSVGNSINVSSLCGETTHIQTTNEMPTHNHGVNDPGHPHNLDAGKPATNGLGRTGTGGDLWFGNLGNPAVNSGATNITIANAGTSAAMNVTQRTVLGSFFRKL